MRSRDSHYFGMESVLERYSRRRFGAAESALCIVPIFDQTPIRIHHVEIVIKEPYFAEFQRALGAVGEITALLEVIDRQHAGKSFIEALPKT